MYDVILRRVCEIIVAVLNYLFWVRVRCITYAACNAHTLYFGL